VTANGIHFGNTEHVEGGLIGECHFALRAAHDNTNVDVTDQGAETLFAFPKGLESPALLGEIGDGDDNAGNFACGIKFWDGVQERPSDGRRAPAAHADHLALNGLFGGQDDGNGPGLGLQLGAVLAKSKQAEVIGGLAEELFILATKRVLDGLIGK